MTTTETGYQLATRLGVRHMTGRCRGQTAYLTLTGAYEKTDPWRITNNAYYSCSVCGSTHARSPATIRRNRAEPGGTVLNQEEPC